MKPIFCLILLMAAVTGCQTRELRGTVEPSQDGKTYLVIEDNNGGACGAILVNGKPWHAALHTAAPTKPGIHTIECGGQIQFEIKEGTTFHFDYWGP